MPAYRLAAVDLNDPRIVEGLRITKEMLHRMQINTDRKTRLLIVLLPSKEAAYSRTARSAGNTYLRLIEMESRVRDELLSQCKDEGIECVDALPALSEAINNGSQLYLTSTSGHPAPEGYSVIASFVGSQLSRLGW
jgi:hypothetical protein